MGGDQSDQAVEGKQVQPTSGHAQPAFRPSSPSMIGRWPVKGLKNQSVKRQAGAGAVLRVQICSDGTFNKHQRREEAVEDADECGNIRPGRSLMLMASASFVATRDQLNL